MNGVNMNRKEAIRQTEQIRRLEALGFTQAEAETLRRISMTLQRWAERECNGEVEVDDDGKAFTVSQGSHWTGWKVSRHSTPNRERGALNRLSGLMAEHPGWAYYHQGDPRGASLYLYQPDSLQPGQDIDSCYSSIGVCVY